MVKFVFVTLLACFSLFAANQDNNQTLSIDTKIESILGSKTYNANKDFINIIFEPKSAYYNDNRLDIVKVVQTLKDNGLLNLFFNKPQTITMNFSTDGSPIFFVKLLEDTLRSIGYYRYITKESHMNPSEFVWSIELTSEYAIDPTIFRKELNKRGCDIVDISTQNPASWSYQIDMKNAHLNVLKLTSTDIINLERSIYEKWLDVSAIKKIVISSNYGNSWYPYISFYDRSLRILKVNKTDSKTTRLSVDIPADTVYIKISDLYTLKNIKNGLNIEAIGSR
ncbi:hypothetical protein [Sulfurimonas sp. HSL-1716]|uniref:hypothetical protein n=1 Tax=Hydrocurvibacter sulfurireducens TaxID=3131937 RepID=UPI0031F7E356